MKKRSLFDELKKGIEEMKQHKAGKITLRSYNVPVKELPEVTAVIIKDTREQVNLSRAVFAQALCISPRTLEKWEQGLARPNHQAATLILLVRKYPDTIKKLQKISCYTQRCKENRPVTLHE